MIKYNNVKTIEVDDWNKLVSTTYNRPYDFQQQDDCKGRGLENITVPADYVNDYENDTIPEEVNNEEMGVSFKAWLARDPNQKLSNPEEQEDYCLRLWWQRNFYPEIGMIVNDLHNKGLLETGEYSISIDW